MGRKSRRNAECVPVFKSPDTVVYPTAIYARLSVENSGKDDDGAALENQIEVCKEYIHDMPDLQLMRVYQDNGWTGTVMRRPAFDELMEDVKTGLIKAIVVRDLSRFARNYIETGTYLESIFPDLDVRFISVKEQLDTLKSDGTNESLMVPLQSLINDLYSKDISRKVEAALRSQRMDGTFKWRTLPYGYMWNESHTGIIPDSERAPFVKKIFEWKAEGLSLNRIIKRLNNENAPRYMGSEGVSTIPWNTGAIYNMLRNPVYVGDRVLGRNHSAIYKGIKKAKTPQTKWVVYSNEHKAIISRELFEKVQLIMGDSTKRFHESMEATEQERKKIVDLFSGKAFCADCGYKMYFRRMKMSPKCPKMYGSYLCSSYQLKRKDGCTTHTISKKTLDKRILESVRIQVKAAIDYEELIKRFRNSTIDQGVRRELDRKLCVTTRELNHAQARRKRLYEDYAEGILDEAEYLYAKKEFEAGYEDLFRSNEALLEQKRAYEEAMSSNNKWVSMLKSVRNSKKLTQGLVDTVVEKVLIHNDDRIELVMKYHDVYEMTKEYLDMLEGSEADE